MLPPIKRWTIIFYVFFGDCDNYSYLNARYEAYYSRRNRRRLRNREAASRQRDRRLEKVKQLEEEKEQYRIAFEAERIGVIKKRKFECP